MSRLDSEDFSSPIAIYILPDSFKYSFEMISLKRMNMAANGVTKFTEKVFELFPWKNTPIPKFFPANDVNPFSQNPVERVTKCDGVCTMVLEFVDGV